MPSVGPAPTFARATALAWAIGLWGCALPERTTEPTTGPASSPGDASTSSKPAAIASTEPISDDPVVRAIVDIAGFDSEVDDHARTLAVDIGPRLTGSTQLIEAEQWAVAEFESWGLVATREQWGELPVGFERGKATGAVIRPERAELEFTTWAWTPGTRAIAQNNSAQALEAGAPVRGQALRYPTSAAELRALGPYLRQAWIMLPFEFDRGALDPTLAKQIERAFARAPIAGWVRAAGDADDLLIHNHGDPFVDPAKLPKRVEIWLRGDQHAGLLERMRAGEYVELEFGVANRWLDGPIPVHNVIAELPGTEVPDERVIVGGHLDSWDGASGAVDNATGVATTMEAARLIAAACERTGRAPRRTISFMLWSGEEQGGLGSAAWVTAHPEQLERISAVLVHDHGTNHISGIAVTPEMWSTMQQVFAPIERLAPETMPFTLRLVEALPWEPTDSSSFLRAGVPGFFWDQAGRSDYTRYHHTQHDHVDAVIDEYQRHSALVVAIAAWNLAELEPAVTREHAFELPARRLEVGLDETVVLHVIDTGVGAAAGLVAGDRVIAVDGQPIATFLELTGALQRGGPHKTLTIERQAVRVELALDWTGDPNEPARAQRRADRRARFEPQLRPWDPDPEDHP